MYYLIEKWTEYEDRPCGSKYTRFDVREFKTPSELEKAILKGSMHGGEIFAAKKLELRLILEEDDLETYKKIHKMFQIKKKQRDPDDGPYN
ncbi:hypothetical protein HY643_03310 [Candidatus Woesearchaeota archaeon]|nr:hypothetical protein [Candidatus Woesearchaeota archaeon]